MPEPDAAVLVINFNSCNDALSAIREIILNDKLGLTVVVVDNASTDDSVINIKREYPQVILIENDENLGFAKACNTGLKNIKESYVLIMNPDVVIKHEDIDELVKFLNYHPDAAAVGPKLEKPDGSLLPSVYRLPTLMQELGHLFCIECLIPESLKRKLTGTFLSRSFGQLDPHDRVRRCEMLVGSCVMFRKSALDDVGGFDEDFFLYYEEKDLFKRLREKGYHTYFTPFARATHEVGASAATVPELAFVSRYESMMRYHQKHSGRFVNWVLGGLVKLKMKGK